MKRIGTIAAIVAAFSVLFFACDNGNGNGDDDNKNKDTTVKVTGVVIQESGSQITTTGVIVGDNKTLTAVVSPDNATNKTVSWASSDTSKVTVTQAGVIHGVAEGEATITVTTNGLNASGNSETASVTVTVTEQAIYITSVTLMNGEEDAAESISLGVEESITLTAVVAPDTTTELKDIEWTSDHPEIASVEDGVITWKDAGTAIITVTTVGSKDAEGTKATDSIRITAAPRPKVESITIKANGVAVTEAGLDLYNGAPVTLVAEVLPALAAAADKVVSWASDAPSIATVGASTGVLTYAGSGTANITATAAGKNESGGNVIETIKVTTKTPPALVVFNQADGSTSNPPSLTDKGRYVISNTQDAAFSSAELPNAVWKNNMLVYLNTPIEGDFAMEMRLNITKFNGTPSDGAWSGAWIGAFNAPTMKTADFATAATDSWGFVGARKVYSGDDRMLSTRNTSTGSGANYTTNKLFSPNSWGFEYIYAISRVGTTYTIEVKNSKTGIVMASGTRSVGSDPKNNYTDILQGAVYLGVMITNCEIEISNYKMYQGANLVYAQTPEDPGYTPVKMTAVELSVANAITGAGFDYLNPIKAVPEAGIDVIASLTPVNTTDDLEWSITGSNATVDQNGHITVSDIGEFTVTATSKADAAVTDSFSFKIIADYDPLESITIDGPTEVNVDAAIQLTATIEPPTAFEELYWSSSDENKATVDQRTGLVTGIAEGEVTITVTSYDGDPEVNGGEVTGTYIINVLPAKTIIWQWRAADGPQFSGNDGQMINGMSVMRTGGTVSSTTDGLQMGAARWVLGYGNGVANTTVPTFSGTGSATSNKIYVTNGELDLTQPFTVTVKYASSSAGGNFWILLNNNQGNSTSGVFKSSSTSSNNNSLKAASPPEAGGGTIEVTINPETDLTLTDEAIAEGIVKNTVLAHSFLQFRCDSSCSSMLVTEITIAPAK